MSQNELKKQIQSYCFAAYDMLLYLDTHKDDKKAFQLFKELTRKAEELKEQYHQKYGPLNIKAAADYTEFNWIDEPWPWEKGGNA